MHILGRGGVRTEFWWINLRERDHLEDLGVDGRITAKWIFKKFGGEGVVDWIYLAYYGDNWRALVSAVINLRVP
jgi:hypothetical protein